MTEIQNPKREYDLEERTFQFAKPVFVIEYCNLRFICNLVLVYCFLHKMQRNDN